MAHSLTNHGFLVFRSPLLPYHTLTQLTTEKIRSLYSDPLLQSALFIASPEMYIQCCAWLNNEVKNEKDRKKIELTLTKYLLRASYRCTPFGLFAGLSLVHLAQTTNICYNPANDWHRHTRLDMDFIHVLSQHIANIPDLQHTISYFPNNTIYQIGEKMRYVIYEIQQNMRDHHLVDVDYSPYLTQLLDYARKGATHLQLISILQSQGIEKKAAADFINQMIENQLLVSELEPTITGEPYTHRLIEILQKYKEGKPIATVLEQLLLTIQQTDEQDFHTLVANYKALSIQIGQFGLPFDTTKLFQVDVYKSSVSNTLTPHVTEQLQKTIQLLSRIQSVNEPTHLIRFREAFRDRYENQSIPLLQALDIETGIGYPIREIGAHDFVPLLENIMLPATTTATQSIEWSPWQQFLLDSYTHALRHHQEIIYLNEKDLKPFMQEQSPALPTSLYSIGYILAQSANAIDQGDFIIYHQATTGPSAANLLGRFCHMSDELTQHVRQITQEEEKLYPEAVFAEIVHLNQARVGNIAVRPHLRNYEIPIVTPTGTDSEHTILLEDLDIFLRNNRLVLYSRRLQKEVIPRLSTAHLYSANTIPAYHFLCDLQLQQLQRGISWDWGVVKQADYLPRVQYDKVIVSKAQWHLNKYVLDQIKNLSGSALKKYIQQLRESKNIPQHITIKQADALLPIDLRNDLCLELLQQHITQIESSLLVEENLFTQDNVWIEGPNGRFTHEFILPIQYPVSVNSIQNTPPATTITRSFPPGSEWTYVKIYCGINTADELLLTVIKPLSEELLEGKLIDKWFFIRYTDPNFHLRIRFHETQAGAGQILQKLYTQLQPYLSTNLIFTIQADTYQRELERYGDSSIEESETLFYHDSLAVLALLNTLAVDPEPDEIRWQAALWGTDQWLTDFGLSLQEKQKLLFSLQTSFKNEFNLHTSFARKSLGEKYRLERNYIRTLLETIPDEKHPLFSIAEVWENRRYMTRRTISQLKPNFSSQQWESLVGSHIHMFLNRVFRSQPRKQEMVIYDFLYQYYHSRLMQENKTSEI
ncbi:lantibiotic dehydratase [Cytophagaceae bacterium DM2B3-1]|uniref:Lantibiotic dehydratase n=1 Tax=Xanthocytophaga flava TaxID=3048013 RepID=A0ABT7CY95_9BACT|nr:lantibiotic dehydratase [Xanthocytophaga flavus]MDJ1498471.1 lantibiotic dehydratase [Xanthocytophaga flavus]